MAKYLECSTPLPRNAYVGLDSDINWFGQRSIDPATLTLKEVGRELLQSLKLGRGNDVFCRIQGGRRQLCDKHHVEQHQTPLLQ